MKPKKLLEISEEAALKNGIDPMRGHALLRSFFAHTERLIRKNKEPEWPMVKFKKIIFKKKKIKRNNGFLRNTFKV